MRGLVPLLLAASLPVVAASQPTEPWVIEGSTVDGSGTVGEPIEVTVRVKANTDLDASIEIVAPEWVVVEGDAWHATASAGSVVENSWTLVPTQEGFWIAYLQGGGQGYSRTHPVALGFASGAPESTVGTSAADGIPVALIDRTVTAAPQDDGTVLIERAVIPVSSWLSYADIRVWVTPGSTYLCGECAVRMPDPAHEIVGRGNDTVTLSARLPLADGEAYTLWDAVKPRFDQSDKSSLSVEFAAPAFCENRRWGTDESWGCDVPSKEWSHLAGPGARLREAVPFAGASMVALALGIACALMLARASRKA